MLLPMSSLARVINWPTLPTEDLNPLLKRQFVSGAQGTIAHLQLKHGALVPTHSHPNEQFCTIITGSLRFILDPDGAAEPVTLNAGDMLIIPGNLPHSAEALEDTHCQDVFAPVRADWESGNDAYLRK